MKCKKMHKTGNVIKKFKCNHCDWSFNKSNLLHRHMRTHTGEKPFEVCYFLKFLTILNIPIINHFTKKQTRNKNIIH